VKIIGALEFDLEILQPIIRAENINAGRHEGDVTITIEMKVIDRYMDFNARWVSEDGEEFVIPGAQSHFSLASAFLPGTQ
jgi:hypothetical protein